MTTTRQSDQSLKRKTCDSDTEGDDSTDEECSDDDNEYEDEPNIVKKKRKEGKSSPTDEQDYADWEPWENLIGFLEAKGDDDDDDKNSSSLFAAEMRKFKHLLSVLGAPEGEDPKPFESTFGRDALIAFYARLENLYDTMPQSVRDEVGPCPPVPDRFTPGEEYKRLDCAKSSKNLLAEHVVSCIKCVPVAVAAIICSYAGPVFEVPGYKRLQRAIAHKKAIDEADRIIGQVANDKNNRIFGDAKYNKPRTVDEAKRRIWERALLEACDHFANIRTHITLNTKKRAVENETKTRVAEIESLYRKEARSVDAFLECVRDKCGRREVGLLLPHYYSPGRGDSTAKDSAEAIARHLFDHPWVKDHWLGTVKFQQCVNEHEDYEEVTSGNTFDVTLLSTEIGGNNDSSDAQPERLPPWLCVAHDVPFFKVADGFKWTEATEQRDVNDLSDLSFSCVTTLHVALVVWLKPRILCPPST